MSHFQLWSTILNVITIGFLATNNLKYEVNVNSYLKCSSNFTYKILRLITQSKVNSLSKGATLYLEKHTNTLCVKCRLYERYSTWYI
jgi:hypothetical protein